MEEPTTPQTKKTINIKLDWRTIAIALLVILVICVVLWRPWQRVSSNRKITVSGQTTIKAEPDQYQFNVTYQKSGEDTDAIQKELDAKAAIVVEELKKLGVEEKSIQLNSNSYAEPTYSEGSVDIGRPEISNYAAVSLTITVTDKALAQKAQDYLKTTGAEGTVTPYPSFSNTKQKELDNQARDKAVDDAKAKAEQTAKQLGVKLGKVIEIKDSVPGGIMPMYKDSVMATEGSTATLPILAGEQEYTYSVEAIFEIK